MRQRRAGFTLLEVLVATTIMALAVATLLSALSTSLTNASRVTDADRAAVIAKRVMDDLIAAPQVARGQVLQGKLDPKESGMEGTWRAQVDPFEPVPGEALGGDGIDRIAIEVSWGPGLVKKKFRLEGYRRAALPEEPKW